ncbi:MAG: hypothetical protein PVI26_11765 [Chitinispirillia bacterium]|jgi:hypothetical protein
MKLNGWQRLWVVFTIIWVSFFGLLTFQSKSSELEIYHNWSQDLLNYLVSQDKDLKNYSVTSLRSVYARVSDKELVKALHEKYLTKHPAYRYGFKKINSKYENLLVHGSNKGYNQKYIYIAFIIPLLVYIFGIAITWVKKGFKNS